MGELETTRSAGGALPKQPDIAPPPVPAAPVPSLGFYVGTTVASILMLYYGFHVESERLSGLLVNLGSNFLGVVVVLIVIDRRIRPGDVERVKGATVGARVRAATLLHPETRHVVGYCRALAARIELPKNEIPDLGEIWRRHPGGFVLVGSARGGKTTFLQKFALAQATEGVRHPRRGRVPVVMALRAWEVGRGAENVRGQLQRFYRMPDARFEALLRKGKLMLLLDGLDEVPLPVRGGVMEEVVDLRRRHAGTVVVVSTRRGHEPTGEELPVVEAPEPPGDLSEWLLPHPDA